MKIIIILLATLCSFNAGAAPQSERDFSKWMTHYYLHPEPASIAPAIKYAFESRLLDDVRKSGPPIFGFIAGAVKRNPELADMLVREFSSFNEEQYALLLIGIWYADLPHDQSRKIVAKALERHPALKKTHPFLLQSSVDLLAVSPKRGAWVLDALWGNFMATGDKRPVINIISVLPWMDESKKSEVIAMGKPGLYLVAVSGAAKWSLTSNAQQHPRVLAICEAQISLQEEPIATQLRTIVAKARAEKNPAHGDARRRM